MAGNDSVRPRRARDVASWDLEADVVIVGYGGAGVGAAIEASHAGADVLVLERAGGAGGASFMSGGYVYAGGGTALQKACGFEDTPDNMFNFLSAATGPNPNVEKLRVYCDESPAYFDWLVSMGIPYKENFYSEPTWMIPGDHSLSYSGGENAYPWNEIATPAPRAHVAVYPEDSAGDTMGGSVVMNHLLAAAETAGVRHEYDIRALRLIVDDEERVVGLVARRYGADLNVRARRGVVLAAGGFMASQRMKEKHAPHLLGSHVVGTDGDDGRGIQMAQAIGGATQLMDRGEAAFMVNAYVLFNSMIVNKQAQRFINEDGYPGRVGQAILANQGQQAYAVFDLETSEAAPKAGNFPSEPTWASDSLSELEEQAGLPEGALTASVEYYNKYAAEGRDPVFHKNPKWLRPLTPPYGILNIPAAATASFTLGGLLTSASGAVLDLDDEPIAGLYAAGRTASGIPAYGYLSGASLGDSIFFGRKAGQSAAAQS